MEKFNNLEAPLNNPKNESEGKKMVKEKEKSLEELRDGLFEELDATEEEKNSVFHFFTSSERNIMNMEEKYGNNKYMRDFVDKMKMSSINTALDFAKRGILGARPFKKAIADNEELMKKIDNDYEKYKKSSDQKIKELKNKITDLSNRLH